jgi:hypothetical protein
MPRREQHKGGVCIKYIALSMPETNIINFHSVSAFSYFRFLKFAPKTGIVVFRMFRAYPGVAL